MTTKIARGTCLNCPGSEDTLEMDAVLYNGFGGFSVTKNGETFYEGDCNGEWESFKKLSDIEEVAKENPGDWKVVLYTPMRGATWTRNVYGEWILTETNQGFA